MRIILNIGNFASANYQDLDGNQLDGHVIPTLPAIVGTLKSALPCGARLACIGLVDRGEDDESTFVVYCHCEPSAYNGFLDAVQHVIAPTLSQDCIACCIVDAITAPFSGRPCGSVLRVDSGVLLGAYSEAWGCFAPEYFVTYFDELCYW